MNLLVKYSKKFWSVSKIIGLKKIDALIVMFNGGYPENIKKFYDIKKSINFL